MPIDSKFVNRARREFPAVERDSTGKKRIFLDNGAGTLVTKRSAAMEADARIDWSANVGNVFSESKGAEEVILAGRRAVSDFLRAEGPEAIVSGESATSLLFGLSYALGKKFTGTENIVVSGFEHFANINPWVELGNVARIEQLRFAKFDQETGLLDMEEFKSRIDKKTRVVSVSAASNVLGTRADLIEIGKMAKEVGAYFVVDAVHHAAHGPTDVKKIGCDFLVFSGYKLFSRHGSFMYCRPDLIERLRPYKVDPAPRHGPEKWEWGTRDQAMFAAITGAIDYISWLGNPVSKKPVPPGPQRAARIREAMESIERYEREISRIVLDGYAAIHGLRYIPKITVYGPKDAAPKGGRDPTFSFKITGRDDVEVAKLLWDKYRIAVGAEDYYSIVPAQYKIKTMLRVTFAHYNTKNEALTLLKALHEIATGR